MKKLLISLFVLLAVMPVMAQRVIDKLDRGLIAQKATTGMYLSWRIQADEYYDVTYNVYRDGVKVNEKPLSVSNYTDKSGTTASKYTVAAVVRGKEQAQSKPAAIWNTSYMEIKPKHDSSIKSTLIPNDACCADVDGDGEVEILLKYDNQDEMGQSYPKNGPKFNGVDSKEYSIFECLKLDGTVLWWVNCGPNMGDFQNNEQNIVGYDWNCDGKAEVVMRLMEGSTIHYANGTTYTIGANGKNGTSWTNYRQATGGGTNWFMHDGVEFLVYCNGETGEINDIINYPLARVEPGEDYATAWGDGYGHRSSKFFFGAPYLDGKKPSIFLARGIYTQIKMCAFDVDPSTNKLVKRWDWRQTNGGYWMWQGYHNFGVADVDMDGRDEIVYGSMVIDDNGKGLSTTGLGHGDAQHCGDFNPYTKGLEIYACNEDQPGNNYRDATTSKIYHRFEAGNDDGRAMMDNFSDSYPGSIGCSAREGAISSVTYGAIEGMGATGINTNFRIYWDGDLCSETFNYLNGKNTEGCVAKYGSWSPIYTCAGSMTNNDTKGTPCYQGDILGDWREEIIMRTGANNIRIYSTPTPTTYRNYSLWYDHQYRNAMVWQMCGYNQPPHVSYFLGKLEGITMAPPPLTMTGREEVKNGETIGAALNDKHVIVCETGNSTVAIENGVMPHVLTFNVPSWVQGTAGTNYTAKNAKINYEYYTCDVTGGALAGSARLVKQGDGILNLPNVEMTHTGATDIWEGKLNFDGKMKNSSLWLNRFAELNSNGGQFRSIKADYASVIRPGNANAKGVITTDSLMLGFGSRIIIDLYGEDVTADQINAKYLSIEKKTGNAWIVGGPQYLAPVVEIVGHNKAGESKITPGKYVIGTLPSELKGNLSDLILEGLSTVKKSLYAEDGKLILEIIGQRDATTVAWNGSVSSLWDLAETENFSIGSGEKQESTVFVSGDNVVFNDEAANKTVTINEVIVPDTVKVSNTTPYTFNGTGAISGTAAFVKENTGTVTMSGNNSYTGGNYLRGGTTKVSLLSNQYSETGNLGAVTNAANKFTMENGAILLTSAAVEMGSPMTMKGEEGGVINNSADFKMDKVIYGTLLTKKGSGAMTMTVANSLTKLIVNGGTVTGLTPAKTVEMQSGTLNLYGGSSCPINVPKGKTATLRFTDGRGVYTNPLTGAGTVTVWHTTATGAANYAMRTQINGNWSAFEGTVKPTGQSGDGRFIFNNSYGLPKATLDIASGSRVRNTGVTFAIGKLTGAGELGATESLSQGAASGTAVWNVGDDTNFTFDGTVVDGAVFNKVGTGTMTVKGIWTNTGRVTIKAGTMKYNNSASLGKGMLTVEKDATLQSTATSSGRKLTNSSIVINGTLLPNISGTSGSGAMFIDNKNLTVSETGTLRLGLNKVYATENLMSGCYIDGANKLTINGTISLFFYNYVPQSGDTFRIWRNVASFAGNPIIVCDDYNVEFDTSRLAEGYLVVKSVAAGIGNITVAGGDRSVKYNVNGQRVNDSAKGIIIVNGKKILRK